MVRERGGGLRPATASHKRPTTGRMFQSCFNALACGCWFMLRNEVNILFDISSNARRFVAPLFKVEQEKPADALRKQKER